MPEEEENKGADNQVQSTEISTLLKDAKQFKTLKKREKNLHTVEATLPEILMLGDYLFQLVLWSKHIPEDLTDHYFDLCNLHEMYEEFQEKA